MNMWAIASKQPRWLLKNHFPLYQASLTVLLGWMSSLRSPLSPCPCILETDILATSLSPPTHHTPTTHQPRSRLVRPDATSPQLQEGRIYESSSPSKKKKLRNISCLRLVTCPDKKIFFKNIIFVITTGE